MRSKKPDGDLCPLCGGALSSGKTTFSVDSGTSVVVVRNVPASICGRCGSEWFDDPIVAELERKTEDARRRGTLIEVSSLP